jgi:hypothetical protein
VCWTQRLAQVLRVPSLEVGPRTSDLRHTRGIALQYPPSIGYEILLTRMPVLGCQGGSWRWLICFSLISSTDYRRLATAINLEHESSRQQVSQPFSVPHITADFASKPSSGWRTTLVDYSCPYLFGLFDRPTYLARKHRLVTCCQKMRQDSGNFAQYCKLSCTRVRTHRSGRAHSTLIQGLQALV